MQQELQEKIVPSIVLSALDNPKELKELLIEEAKMYVQRLRLIGMSKGAIREALDVGYQYGRPASVNSRRSKTKAAIAEVDHVEQEEKID